MKFLFKLLLTFSSTSWMLIVYKIKTATNIIGCTQILEDLACILLTFSFSIIALLFTKALAKDEINKCETFALADNEFLPVYLGYFFIALSINSLYTLCFIYAIVFVFTFLLNAYFNPAFIICGYHYYHVTTIDKSHLLVICKSLERNPQRVSLRELRRINNLTYISDEEESK